MDKLAFIALVFAAFSPLAAASEPPLIFPLRTLPQDAHNPAQNRPDSTTAAVVAIGGAGVLVARRRGRR